MPKKLSNALTVQQVKSAKPGRHTDGAGLQLLVKESGARSWVFRYMLNGKSRDVGISKCPEAIALLQKTGARELTLSQARDVAAIYRHKVQLGIDPLTEREQATLQSVREQHATAVSSVTFQKVAEAYVATKSAQWRNPKHRQQWRNTLRTYVYPKLGMMPVQNVETKHVLEVLIPIWQAKPETASRVRGRIEVILDSAKVQGYRSGENPARWRGHLEHTLAARQKLSRGHHAALPHDEVPSFVQKLWEQQSIAALALEFTILTACRTGEVLGATWDEVDFKSETWTIPAERMKAGKEHRVPLSKRAVQILRETKKISNTYLFPGRGGNKLSGMAMTMQMRRMKVSATVHGFRSSFRDWAAETTSYPQEVCEMALAHSITNATEAAYRRGDLFEKRRQLMNAWAQHCEGDDNANAQVVNLKRGG